MLTTNQMIEFYLFINPMDKDSFENIQNILTFTKTRQEKVKLHILPLLNLPSFNHYMYKNNLSEKDLDMRNKLFSQTYDMCLSFIAASMQGKKKGRNFLLDLQDAVFNQNRTYSEELILEIAEQTKIDVPMFIEDKASDFVKTTFSSDQKVAREMNIETTPSCVMFNDSMYEYGLLLENKVSYSLLNNLYSIAPNQLDTVIEKNVFPSLRVLN
ncbi:DsbA family protein [Desemzia sp. RIT804]|uniref:DsbA family protein n=1 Tax=Desemzia sp. RIT 804 TaxID=2810209 RepID=UPI0019507573|nr:DsbA family protein [Desemzia sp. RIT 804]MBM6613461.1 DsbA family protein [Desemzia sp. RIT 804]